MMLLTTLASAALLFGAADDHAEPDFVAACEAYTAENPEATADCGCLAEKVAADPEVGAELGAMAEGAAPGEKAAAALSACGG